MKRDLLTEGIPSLIILLFVFTGTSKIYEPDIFRFILSTSPLISNISSVVAWGLPVVLLMVALLLIIPRVRKWGLWSSFIFTLLFTLYISYMLAFAFQLPSLNDGVFKQLTWNQHLILNVIIMALTLCSLWLDGKSTFPKNRITHALIPS